MLCIVIFRPDIFASPEGIHIVAAPRLPHFAIYNRAGRQPFVRPQAMTDTIVVLFQLHLYETPQHFSMLAARLSAERHLFWEAQAPRVLKKSFRVEWEGPVAVNSGRS